jgi:hypothetical protein
MILCSLKLKIFSNFQLPNFGAAYTAILSNTSFGQSSKDEQLVKNLVLAYQDDYNDGGFKNVASDQLSGS